MKFTSEKLHTSVNVVQLILSGFRKQSRKQAYKSRKQTRKRMEIPSQHTSSCRGCSLLFPCAQVCSLVCMLISYRNRRSRANLTSAYSTTNFGVPQGSFYEPLLLTVNLFYWSTLLNQLSLPTYSKSIQM